MPPGSRTQNDVGTDGAGTHDDLALVLTGGGARAAYQVGVLAWLAERNPGLEIPILTGVSAGAVNVGHLASHHGSFQQSLAELVTLWSGLTADRVFESGAGAIAASLVRWGAQLFSGGSIRSSGARSLLDTKPLFDLLDETFVAVDGQLTRIDYNIQRGSLKAAAISTTSYTTGQNIVWLQAADSVRTWTRPERRAVRTRLAIDHIVASAALPLFFPAVQIGNAWYGDGGIRLTAPLSPAIHLGARRILAISTRARRSQNQADMQAVKGYPPPAQVFGVLMNAVFLDLIDQDAIRLERINQLIEKLPTDERGGMRCIDLVVMRPSRDLGRLARAYEPRLPAAFRFMTRGLGTRQTRSSDLLSMLMFQPDYLKRLIEMGREDAAANADILQTLVSGERAPGHPRLIRT